MAVDGKDYYRVTVEGLSAIFSEDTSLYLLNPL